MIILLSGRRIISASEDIIGLRRKNLLAAEKISFLVCVIIKPKVIFRDGLTHSLIDR